MKSSTIKTICTGLFLIFFMKVIPCMAQDKETKSVVMMPEIPSDLTEPSQRANYLVLHFWDNFNFRDTAFLMADHLMERSFVDFVDLLSLVPEQTVNQAIHTFLKKPEDDRALFSYILKLSERYLYEPESPICNEEILIPIMQYALQSSLLTEIEKIRPKFLLDNILKNRIGTVANDFTYTLINGETGNLHAIKADHTLLYFNDPECDDCMMLIKKLTVSPVINQLVQSGKLKIITVYVNDDLEAWKKHAPEVLRSWLYAYDAEQKINPEGIYDIKQFPTLYLLDRDKKVILKDTSFDKLENYFKMY